MYNEKIDTITRGFSEIELAETAPADFVAYYKKNRQAIEHRLTSDGAVKFTGVQISSVDEFQHIVDSISDKFLSYVDGNSPRTKLSGNVYTSTEYDKTQRITMHNELSYSAKWPNKIFFSCLKTAATGGSTLLADSRVIFQNMDKYIVDEVLRRGIVYIRNLHGGEGMGPSWQDTFETTDKNELEAICRSYAIDFEWIEKDNLRLKQPGKGIIRHRLSKELLWFNQIDQFHPCHLGDEMFEVLKIVYESPDRFPMYVTFGDGTEIPESFIAEILDTIATVTVAPVWGNNELLILDNELMTHGREAYTGDRKVVVAMSE
jgi:alpha-ketoglutarate-dependent taurine dioxygenase